MANPKNKNKIWEQNTQKQPTNVYAYANDWTWSRRGVHLQCSYRPKGSYFNCLITCFHRYTLTLYLWNCNLFLQYLSVCVCVCECKSACFIWFVYVSLRWLLFFCIYIVACSLIHNQRLKIVRLLDLWKMSKKIHIHTFSRSNSIQINESISDIKHTTCHKSDGKMHQNHKRIAAILLQQQQLLLLQLLQSLIHRFWKIKNKIKQTINMHKENVDSWNVGLTCNFSEVPQMILKISSKHFEQV